MLHKYIIAMLYLGFATPENTATAASTDFIPIAKHGFVTQHKLKWHGLHNGKGNGK